MGGFGSGRPGWKRKTGEMLRLDVVWLNKRGCLSLGKAGIITWTSGYGNKSSISFESTGGALRLTFTVSVDGAERESVVQMVHLERTPCRLGGGRSWFLCPGCGRRVGVLYGQRLFLCRVCHRLTYASQCEGQSDRLLRRANLLRARLGGEPGISAMIRKPKRMRWATFERLTGEIHDLETAGLTIALERFGVEL